MTKAGRFAVAVSVGTALGFAVDVLIYSFGKSKSGEFKFHMPKGKEIYQLLAFGAISGFGIEYVTSKVVDISMSEQEKQLLALVKNEMDTIDNGLKKGTPVSIVYA